MKYTKWANSCAIIVATLCLFDNEFESSEKNNAVSRYVIKPQFSIANKNKLKIPFFLYTK